MNDVNFEFTPNLEKVIARLPDQWQHLFRRLGLKYSESTLPRVPVEKSKPLRATSQHSSYWQTFSIGGLNSSIPIRAKSVVLMEWLRV